MNGPNQIEWLNNNSYRRYPFIEDSDMALSLLYPGVTIPNDAILEFMPRQTTGDRGTVILKSVDCSPTVVAFTFEFTAIGSLSQLVYTVPITASFPYRAVATALSGQVSATAIFGQGVVTMSTFASGVHTLPGSPAIEPALLFYVIKDRVLDILGTEDGSTAVTGDIYIKEGHNCKVTIDPVTNTVRVSGLRGAGKGVNCGLPAAGDMIRCPEALLRINGLSAGSNGEFALVGGEGVSIVSDAANHKITIKGNSNLDSMRTCGGD